jgi:4-amino-4-deoxychorismate lyase
LYTPTTFLLKGTKREFLLSKGLISERELRIENIFECESFYMINAMVEPIPVTVIL